MTPARLAAMKADALRDARRCDDCEEASRYACRACGAGSCGVHLVVAGPSGCAHRWRRAAGSPRAVIDLVREVRRLSAQNYSLRVGGAVPPWVPALPDSILDRAAADLPPVKGDAARLVAARTLARLALPWFTIRDRCTRGEMVRELGALVDGELSSDAVGAATAALTVVALADDAPGADDVGPALAALALVEDVPPWLGGLARELVRERASAGETI